MQNFPRKMENLSAEQLEQLLKRIKQRKREKSEKNTAEPMIAEGIPRSISPMSTTGRFPISFAQERLAFILQDSGAKLLLTDSHLASLFTESAGTGDVRIVCLDTLPANTEPITRALPAVEPENLAYVMYTSGSTGAPKGVAVTHRNVVRLVKNNDYANFPPIRFFCNLLPSPLTLQRLKSGEHFSTARAWLWLPRVCSPLRNWIGSLNRIR